MNNNTKVDLNDILNKYLIFNSINLDKILKNIDPFIDLIVTSPPYWDMKKYGEIQEQTGFGQSYEEYLNDIRKTFKNIYNLSKDSSSLYLIIDTTKRDGNMIRLPDEIANCLEEIGWIHQDTIIWDKGKTLPWSRKGQMRNVFEYILVFSKTQNFKYYIDRIKTVDELKEWWHDYPERYNSKGKVPDNIWQFYIPTQGSWGSKKDFGEDEFRHACPFPPEMVARIILLATDKEDVVFDPYAGTGVLLRVAEALDRNFLGTDTNIEYKKVFENVTKQLIEEKMIEISNYYKIQTKLQKIMEDSIFKLRVLKYPNALLKKIRTLHKNFPEKYIQNDFILNFAFATQYNEEKNNKLLGKVHYVLVWKNAKTLSKIKQQIEEIINKAPFTKYGLDINIEIITIKSLESYLENLNGSLYAYIKGNTKSFAIEYLSYKEVLKLNDIELNEYMDKDIPPLISNLKIHKNDYALLPAEQYTKKGYVEIIEKYRELLND